jgi:hypothetical protein
VSSQAGINNGERANLFGPLSPTPVDALGRQRSCHPCCREGALNYDEQLAAMVAISEALDLDLIDRMRRIVESSTGPAKRRI